MRLYDIHMNRFALLVLMLTVAVWAQENAGRWPVETLAVEGNRHYEAPRILAVAGLKIGQMAGKQEFEAARDRLLATGMFETVGYRFAPAPGGKGYAASFQVVEIEPLYPVRFEDLEALDSQVAAYVGKHEPLFGTRLPGTAPVLERYARRIQEFLASLGREEKIVGRLVPGGKADELVVLFRPARPLPAVAQVSFTGNQAVPTRALREAISGVAIGTGYREERFRQLLDTSVRPLYEARGHLRVAWTKIETEPAPNVEGVNVKVEIDEGGSFELAAVAIEGAEGFDNRELLAAAKLKTGETANFDEVKEGAERVRKLLQRNGHMRAGAAVERSIDDAAKTVSVTIRLEPGPRFTFRKLEIRGLDLHGEAAIRKLWLPKPGDAFNVDYPQYFLSRVQSDGIFDNLNKTRADTSINEEERTVDVTLHFNP